MPDFDYGREPLEVIEQKTYIVYDPWLGEDIGTFTSLAAAEMFAKLWEEQG